MKKHLISSTFVLLIGLAILIVVALITNENIAIGEVLLLVVGSLIYPFIEKIRKQ